MKAQVKLWWLVVVVFLMPLQADAGFEKFLIEDELKGGKYDEISIYGNTVVWNEEERYYAHTIFGYNLQNSEKFQIVSGVSRLSRPYSFFSLHNDIVVWVEGMKGDHGSFDAIFTYNLQSGEKSRIQWEEQYFNTSIYDISIYDISIYDNNIVWRGGPYPYDNIFLYDLTTSTEKKLTVDDYLFRRTGPDICKNKVVWWTRSKEYPGGTVSIYDLNTGETSQIEFKGSSSPNLKIYDDIIVWEDTYNDPIRRNADVFIYNLKTSEELQITPKGADQRSPAIYDNIVVWSDWRNGNWDIYGYDLETGKEFPICTDELHQIKPAIYEDTVIWIERSPTGIWGIYGAVIPEPTTLTLFLGGTLLLIWKKTF